MVTEFSRHFGHWVSDHLPPRLAARLAAGHYRRLLARLGPDAEPDLQVCLALLQPGDRVVDVGAHVGLYSLACARRVGPRGQVLALEPMPWTYAVLRRLGAESGCTNLTLLRVAASDADGLRWMSVPRDRYGLANHYLAQVTAQPEPRGRRVSAVALDGLLRTLSVALLKVDVEGHELPCLQGSMETIRRCRPALLVEIGGPTAGPSASERAAVFTLLGGQGYRVFVLEDGQLHPWSERARGVNHWFLQPEHLARLRSCCPALLGPE
jgi:FkbM family methyltransferase